MLRSAWILVSRSIAASAVAGAIPSRKTLPLTFSAIHALLQGHLHPVSHRRQPVVIDQKKHIPAGRREIAIGWHPSREAGSRAIADLQIDETLAAVPGMGRHAIANQTCPLDIDGLRASNVNHFPVAAAGWCISNNGARSFEKIGRPKYFQSHFFLRILIPFDVGSSGLPPAATTDPSGKRSAVE